MGDGEPPLSSSETGRRQTPTLSFTAVAYRRMGRLFLLSGSGVVPSFWQGRNTRFVAFPYSCSKNWTGSENRNCFVLHGIEE